MATKHISSNISFNGFYIENIHYKTKKNFIPIHLDIFTCHTVLSKKTPGTRKLIFMLFFCETMQNSDTCYWFLLQMTNLRFGEPSDVKIAKISQRLIGKSLALTYLLCTSFNLLGSNFSRRCVIHRLLKIRIVW